MDLNASLLNQRSLRYIILSIVLTFCVYSVAAWWFAEDQLSWKTLQSLPVLFFVCAFICAMSSYLLRYLRWKYLLEADQVPNRQHLLIYFSAFALTTTPGKAGEMIRSYFLAPYDVPYKNSLSTFFVERLTDLYAVTLLTLYIMLLLFPIAHTVGLVIFTTASLVLIKNLDFFSNFFPKRILQLKISQFIINLEKQIHHRLLWKKFLPSLFIGLIVWTFQGTVLYLILYSLKLDITYFVAISVYCAGLISGALSMIPGGIGATEAVIVVLLQQLGVPFDSAVFCSVVTRMMTLWLAVIIGVTCFSYLTIKNK